MKTRQYHYVAVMYSILINNRPHTNSTSFLCSTEKGACEGGIPTTGYMVKTVKNDCKKKGYTYIEDSFFIISIIKLTKAQYEALNDKTEPKE